ncbi:hypothetical protein NBRC116589_13740 [Ruegeria sp. HU-ET01832]|uniref:hypothetical protein n=1 Tax=Ruegeria sp. HU-ET01832 TaxID=3135906 RepID=UPI00147B5B0B
MNAKMNPKSLKKALLDRRLRAELDCLLRVRPFMNEGKRDEGWMCREHSLIVACIAALKGFVPHICWGKMFVTGADYETGELKHLRVDTHSWNAIDDFGFLDLSISLKNGEHSGWRNWKANCMLQNKLYPQDNADFFYFVSHDRARFEHAATLSIQTKKPTIAYLGEEIAILASDYLRGSTKYVNSPLTDELKSLPKFDETIYLKAAWHVWLVLNRKTKPLQGVSRLEAWSHISENYEGADARLLSLTGKLPAS